MDAHLRAGIAIYNVGEYHAAHDAWEEYWLDLEQGTDDEQFLHGLIQFTAAVFHAANRNWSGATGLAESAREYLAALPATYRGVDIAVVRSELATFASDPCVVERRQPRRLTHEGAAVTTEDLDFPATCVAADVLAEEHGYDEALIDAAIAYASEAVEEDTSNPFVGLLFDFVREPDQRPIVVQRLSEHVDRRGAKAADVAGLFDER